ncbi:MAG: LCP family protein [Anaerolineae bacterium]
MFFTTVRALAARTSLPFIDNVARSRAIQEAGPDEQAPSFAARTEPISILLLGIDQREIETGPWRSDTMILVSIDPATNSAAMLSIPRDLWVTIPGYGENRINVAHYLGDLRDYPGGGPALAKKTAWYALGVPVDRYIRVNFGGFERLVDAIGGVTVNVEKPIHDANYPDNNYGTMLVEIPAGIQQMDGQTALQYARSRHGSSDYDRMDRQQAVILAARDKALSLDIPLTNIPKLLEIAGDSVQTDLTVEEMFALADLLKKVDREGIRQGSIEDSMTTTVTTPTGAMVEVADWAKVRALVDTLFPAPVPSAQPQSTISLADLQTEGARIGVQNGTLVVDLAQSVGQRLIERGFQITHIDNADRFDYAQTVIVVYAEKPYSLQALANELAVGEDQIRRQPGARADLDIQVILGRDRVP